MTWKSGIVRIGQHGGCWLDSGFLRRGTGQNRGITIHRTGLLVCLINVFLNTSCFKCLVFYLDHTVISHCMSTTLTYHFTECFVTVLQGSMSDIRGHQDAILLYMQKNGEELFMPINVHVFMDS